MGMLRIHFGHTNCSKLKLTLQYLPIQMRAIVAQNEFPQM